ncbi:MAG: DUF262 domain-containing protein [Calditrichaeota bacterium]|nr:DUF262 domain-containing protein [Calditrichota bacterium]
MQISTILDHIDSGYMALPEFQRGYVWNRDQVRALMDSLYRRHPIGGLLVWLTASEGAQKRGPGDLAPGIVKLLLDGQQRMTSLYGIIRGVAPRFFDGNSEAFTGLHFHLDREEFAFYSPVFMRDDPLWINVSELMKAGQTGLGDHLVRLGQFPDHKERIGDFVGRLSAILGIREIDLHLEEVAGPDKTVDVVVDIFNRVNTGGTKLSKGDLALAKICAGWPEARDTMKSKLEHWRKAGFEFNLDWLLRCVNTVATGEAMFLHLHDTTPEVVKNGVERASNAIDSLLNSVSGRLGLDHERVLFGKYAFPVMAHYLDRRGKLQNQIERDRLLFWFLQCAMWGRYSGQTEAFINRDLELISELDGGLERLVSELRLWRGGLAVEPGHFAGWSLGARFYPVLYMMTRVGMALDWGTGLPLKYDLLGKMNHLEVHHIFPKSLLYKRGWTKSYVNAVANFCFLTKDTNLQISNQTPESYFPIIEEKHPGALASQWIPMDPELWRLENYADFLSARRALLAKATNDFLEELSHGMMQQEELAVPTTDDPIDVASTPAIPGAIKDGAEEQLLLDTGAWVESLGLSAGNLCYELVDPETGNSIAVLDLAWPQGLQTNYSEPVALLIDEGPETLTAANHAGIRVFTNPKAFRQYVEQLLNLVPAGPE